MNTILQSAISSGRTSSEDIDPWVGVDDNHLLVKTHPGSFGVFSADSGDLPTLPAKWFRVTNSSGANLEVTHRVPLLKKYFDSGELEVQKDSGTIQLTRANVRTPNGFSNVLKIEHTADNSAYSHIPSPYGLKEDYTVSCYFKVESNSSQLQPLGLYSNYGGIDINHPAVGLRVNSDNSFSIRVGTTETTVGATHSVGQWYRVRITAQATDAIVRADIFDDLTKLWSSVVDETVSSSGVGLVDELLTKDTFVVAFASEGLGVQYIENFEVYSPAEKKEVLLSNTTKEYDCHRSLDEYSIDGSTTGYYRG